MRQTAKRSVEQTGRREKGASRSRARWADILKGYLSHHRWVAEDSFRRLLKTPVPSLMTWLVIGIALALPTGLFVTLGNVETLGRSWDGAAKISLFMHHAIADADARELSKQIAGRPDVAGVDFVSRAQALAEFEQLSGFGNVLQDLDNNPLPAVILVRPTETDSSAKATEQLYTELAAMPQVERAVLDLEWVQRLYSMMALARKMTLALASLLSLGVLLVIGNTIRLAIEGRRDEIVIVKLVGGTNAFVRRPFLYTGLWYGLGGGLVAWLIILFSLYWLAEPVASLAGLYQSDFRLHGLGFFNTLLLWFGGALLGLTGAWLAVSRHLGAIEPR